MPGGRLPGFQLEVAEAEHSLHRRRDRSHRESFHRAKQKRDPGAVDEVHLAQIEDDRAIGQATQLGLECVRVREVYAASYLDQQVLVLGTSVNVELRRRYEYSHYP
jgi:hypothetical protein